MQARRPSEGQVRPRRPLRISHRRCKLTSLGVASRIDERDGPATKTPSVC